jgi:hypothetical protein
MPKIRDILGHVRIEQAARQRKCRRGGGKVISKGQMFMVVKTNPTNDDYSYSMEPAKAMLDAAWLKLKSLYVALGLALPT